MEAAMEYIFPLMSAAASSLIGLFTAKSYRVRVQKDIPLQLHPFFREIKFMFREQIRRTHFSDDPCRNMLLQDILSIKCRTLHDKTVAFIHESDLNSLEKDAVHEQWNELIHEWHMESTRACEETAVPTIVLDRFKPCDDHAIALMVNHARLIFTSQYYTDNKHRSCSVLNSLLATMETQLAFCEQNYNKLNGELDGVRYKDMTVNPLPATPNDG
jgi:hypothetical protein